MRLIASLCSLTLVLALASCDSSGTTNSNPSLVGTWKYVDTGSFYGTDANDNPTDTLYSYENVRIYKFNPNGSEEDSVSGKTIYMKTGKIESNVYYDDTEIWKTDGDTLFKSYFKDSSNFVDTLIYALTSNTLKLTLLPSDTALSPGFLQVYTRQ